MIGLEERGPRLTRVALTVSTLRISGPRCFHDSHHMEDLTRGIMRHGNDLGSINHRRETRMVNLILDRDQASFLQLRERRMGRIPLTRNLLPTNASLRRDHLHMEYP